MTNIVVNTKIDNEHVKHFQSADLPIFMNQAASFWKLLFFDTRLTFFTTSVSFWKATKQIFYFM